LMLNAENKSRIRNKYDIFPRQPRDIFTKTAQKSIRATRVATRGLIIPELSEVPRWCPWAREGCVRKRGTPSPICMLLYRCFVRWQCGGGHTDTRTPSRGAGVYESIKTHPRQAPARRGPRGWKNASGVNALIMSYRGAG